MFGVPWMPQKLNPLMKLDMLSVFWETTAPFQNISNEWHLQYMVKKRGSRDFKCIFLVNEYINIKNIWVFLKYLKLSREFGQCGIWGTTDGSLSLFSTVGP